MILVTGAAGKTGQAVAGALSRKGEEVRGLVRRRSQADRLAPIGFRDFVVGDMRDRKVLDAAVSDVGAIYHMAPNVHPEETSIGRLVLKAAGRAGVRHFVYHSVLHPQTEAMPHHWQKLRVEEEIFTSGLPFTIFQPSAYMQNVLGSWESIRRDGVYPVPYSAQTRLSLVDLRDIAEAAALVLTSPGHTGATYELSGPEDLSQTQTAALLERNLDRPVRVEEVGLEAWEAQARSEGLGDYQVRTLLQMFRYYNQHGFCGNPRVLRGLLGREPTSFAAFLARLTAPGPGEI